MFRLTTLASVLLAGCALMHPATAGAQDAFDGTATLQFQGDASRERSAGTGAKTPNIGFISSPSPHCYQPDPAQDVCYVAFASIYVDAAPNYVIKLTIDLDGRRVFNASGFFQTSLTLDRSAAGPMGFRVRCGPPSEAEPEVGNSYSFTIRASDSAGLNSANYGSVVCPAFLD